jgi:hypothetical protein
MILTKSAKIKVNAKNTQMLKLHGYLNLKLNDLIEIKIEHLSKGSHYFIEVACDICGKERTIMYKEYLRNLKHYNYYTCKGTCSSDKIRLTNLERYGVEFISQLEEVKNKRVETSIKKYGVEYYSKTEESKNKIKQTNIEKYGVDNPSKFEDFKTKRKGTMIERFGVDYYVLHAEFREKSEKSFMQNFGVKHPMKIKDEVRKRLNKKGLDFETDEYKIYRNKVDYLTRKNKKTLYDSWNGFDFYDKEYILENLHLPGQHGDYPTIDHKKSVKECFDEGLLPLYVAEIDNLCITKRRVNSKKNKKSNFIL